MKKKKKFIVTAFTLLKLLKGDKEVNLYKINHNRKQDK